MRESADSPEYLPAMQSAQLFDPARAAKVPAAQLVQPDAEVPEYFPATQVAQKVLSAFSANLPSAQAVQDVACIKENLPLVQIRHSLWPTVPMYLPPGHDVQLWAEEALIFPTAQYLPDTQALHSETPKPPIFPTAHKAHEPLSSVAENFPLSQLMQALLAVRLNLPAGQFEQTERPVVAASCPAEHSTQSLSPTEAAMCPRRQSLHAFWPLESWYLPRAQLEQTEAPSRLNVPAPQSKQDPDEAVADILPAGQEVHELEPIKLNSPASQIPQVPEAVKANSPALQSMHVSILPVPSDFLPGAQLEHAAVLPSLYLPAVQLTQAVLLLVASDIVPAAQREQEPDDAALL